MIITKGGANVSSWDIQKGKLKAKFPKLTEEDLNFNESRKPEMLRKLEEKLALTPYELKVIMETT